MHTFTPPVPAKKLLETNRRSFAIPQVYMDKVAVISESCYQKVAAAYGHELAVTVVVVDKRSRKKSLLRLIAAVFGGDLEAAVVGEARIGDHIVPLLLPASVDIQFLQTSPDLTPDVKEHDQLAFLAYKPTLSILAQLTGQRIELHDDGGRSNVVPYPPVPGVIHLVSNACPPGQFVDREMRAACGHLLHPEEHKWKSVGPAAGRGVVMKDMYGTEIIQVLGTTWYLLLPIFGPFNSITSVPILTELLILGWKASRQSVPEAETLTRDTFGEKLAGWQEKPIERYRERQAADLQKSIGEYQRMLIQKTGELRRLRRACERALADPEMMTGRQVGPVDFDRLMQGGLITKVVYENDGLHFFTGPIVIEHNGAQYGVGPVTIRISNEHDIFVWSERPVHPKGIAHPHVGEDGSPCLGNATNAILDAVAENRMGDAVLHLIAWLTDGYTPELAAFFKLEEWPRINPVEESHGTELVAAAKAV